MKSFTWDEITKMIDSSGCYIVVSNDKVYDVSSFINKHPGGKFVIKSKNGEDVTKHFKQHPDHAKEKWSKYQIGILSIPTKGCCFI